MDISPRALAHVFITSLPVLIVTVILSAFGRSSNGEHQDLLTELISLLARPILGKPAALLKSQRAFNRDYGVWGRIWVSRWTVPVDSEPVNENEMGKTDECFNRDQCRSITLRQAVWLAILDLGKGYVERDQVQAACFAKNEMPVVHPVEVEWTAYRRNAFPLSPRPALSERQMYTAMMEDIGTRGPTILYFHGGAHCLMDPVTHRWPTSTLAKESGGRVLSVRYRLSPQHVFPASLLDALSVYMALIAPPASAYHEAVPASQIVIAGDSSGAGLAASLLLLLQTLARQHVSVKMRGTSITIPDPVCAGVALASPWLDITRCLPSTTANARWDIIAPPSASRVGDPTPAFPPDEIWPASPPRVETYCTAEICTHPLVSPLAAQSYHWRGVPPVYVCVGWEGMQDETEVFARRIFGADPEKQIVIFDGYAGMPHCFALFPWNWAGRTAMQRWGRFCNAVVYDKGPMKMRARATWTSSNKAKGVVEVILTQLAMTNVGCWCQRERLDDHVVDEKLTEAREWRIKLNRMLVARGDKQRACDA
jgi:acetyl esterase/lipase